MVLAFLANLTIWGENCGKVAAALREGYGAEDDAVALFDFFANPPADFEQMPARPAPMSRAQWSASCVGTRTGRFSTTCPVSRDYADELAAERAVPVFVISPPGGWWRGIRRRLFGR